MTRIECPLSESRIKPRTAPPLLTVFIPTWNRTPEMIEAVESIAGQLTGGLQDKVEVLVSDNASDAPGREAVRALADRFDTVNYMINETDQGGHFQVFSAPWRAQGTWTWVFGSDDVMEPGAIATVLARLKAEDPGFLTVDKSIWNRDLTEERFATANSIPDRTFSGFVDLFKAVGLHQVAFLGASIEKTALGRALDAQTYLQAECYHNYLIAYFEKHQHSKCIYMADALVRRRLDNSGINDYLGVAFQDIGMTFPPLLLSLTRKFGVTDDIFEHVNGSRRISDYDPPVITMVDNIFEYMLRASAQGRAINHFQKAGFEKLCESWRPHRRAQFDELWATSERIRYISEAVDKARWNYERMMVDLAAERRKLSDESIKFTDKEKFAAKTAG